MDKFIDTSKISMTHEESIALLYQACMSLPFNCPPSIFKSFNQNMLLTFCEPIVVIRVANKDQYEICAGFRTYRLCLELDIKSIQVIDISSMNSEEKIKFCYYATLIPLLLYSSPNTHAKVDIKKCLETIQNELAELKDVIKEFNKTLSKHKGRKRKISGKTALQTLLKEITN